MSHLDHVDAVGPAGQQDAAGPATRDLVVSRLDDLGGFLDGPLPDVSVGVSECALGGVQARGH